MTREDKELLIKDLCARLPYGVKLDSKGYFMGKLTYIENYDIEGCHIIRINNQDISEVRPYLFPISSMTEEQKKEYLDICQKEWFNIITSKDMDNILAFYKGTDWLNSHHFDYRGLIDKGLAIDATNFNIY